MRKCVLVSLAILLSWGTLFAQDEDSSSGSEGGYFDAGDLAFEITGSPFATTGGSLLSFGSLRARYAVTTNIVPRLGIEMYLSNTQNTPDAVYNSSSYTLRPGCEYHFAIQDGFRSYAAFDFIVGQRFASSESTTSYSVDGATSVNTSSGTANGVGYFMFGVGAGVGAEYHFNSRFYIGTEVGFNLFQQYKNEVYVDGELFMDKTKSSYVNMNTMSTLRVGFKFL